MRSERLENEDKFLGMFKPEVTKDTTVCCCLSIKTGNIFISILFFIIACIYFFASLYTNKFASFKNFLNCLLYSVIAGFLLYGIIKEKYSYAKISYIIYEIIFVLKVLAYGYAILFNFILIFLKLDWHYIIVVLILILFAIIELGIMCYFIYIIYCFLVITKDSNTIIYQSLEENQKLLKDYEKNDKNENEQIETIENKE